MEGISSKQAVDDLKIGLNDSNKAFIYHCYNHYMCPIGYEETPQMPYEAYVDTLSEEAKD